MATKSNITIRSIDALRVVKVEVLTGTVLAAGDLIDFDGTSAVVHAGEGGTFLGVALEGSESGQIQQISVATIAMVSMLLDSGSAALVLGDAVDYSSGSNGVNWDVEKNTANAIAWCYEQSIAAGAFGLFLINSHDIGDTAKVFDVTT